MITKAYLSNLSPVWPFSRQETALASALPSWPNKISIYRDDLNAKYRRAHKIDSLNERAAMLRQTSGKRDENIYIASLAVLAWNAEDMMECLTLAMKRGSTVHILDIGLTIAPDVSAETLYEAAKAFADSRRSRAAGEAGKTGGAVSAQRRMNMAKAAAETIRQQWALPSKEYPTLDLIRAAGISRNTAILYLGKRTVAQINYQAGQKRKQSAFAKRARFSI